MGQIVGQGLGDKMGSTRAHNKLTAIRVKTAKGPAVLQDGGGLMLKVETTGTRRWVLRNSVAGQRRDYGLGPYPAITLETARTKAHEARARIRNGESPLPAVKQRLEHGTEKSKTTFRQVFTNWFEMKRQSLSNGKHVAQWQSTMETYVFPYIGDRPVDEASPQEVVDILRPIWFEKPETARRVLQRMRSVFDAAIAQELREKASPCIGIELLLTTKHRKVEHHRALPFEEAPAFVHKLRSRPLEAGFVSRLALEFLLLTGSRSGEVRHMRKCEVDKAKSLWIVPGERMKARIQHVVPLSTAALAVLHEAFELAPDGDLVFPSAQGKALSDNALMALLKRMGYSDIATAHGFRSTFKDWCAENDVPDEVSEAALAHTDKNRVRAAYLRTRFVERRWNISACAGP